jgi:hypothetical protein
MPRSDPYAPPELHAQPRMPRNYGDAFAPPQPSNDLHRLYSYAFAAPPVSPGHAAAFFVAAAGALAA